MNNISSVIFRDMTFLKKKAICSSQMLLVVMDYLKSPNMVLEKMGTCYLEQKLFGTNKKLCY